MRWIFTLFLCSFALSESIVAQDLAISTLAGSSSGGGWQDGVHDSARFSLPQGVAVDPSGTIFIADRANHVIRRIAPNGTVSTVAGSAGNQGSQDGVGGAARFRYPASVAIGPDGALYVTDTENHTIRKISPDGQVTTFAGVAGAAGSNDGVGARFTYPRGLDVDSSGTIYVADTSNHVIRKITSAGVVTTLAGSARKYGSEDGFGAQARFYFPFDVAVGAGGFVYVADTNNHMIRKISGEGHTTTVAGSDDYETSPGSRDGIGTEARFNFPWSLDVDGTGTVYVTDTWNHTIRRISPTLEVTTYAGTALRYGNQDSSGAAARFHAPSGIALHTDGSLVVADRYNHAIRTVSTTQSARTLAGSPPRFGAADGRGPAARFFRPEGVAFDAVGNLYVSDLGNTIRKVSPSGVTSTVAGQAGNRGAIDGPAMNAQFAVPVALTVDASGNVIVADSYNYTIRKLTPSGVVSTLAGLAGTAGDAVGSGSQARFDRPYGIAADHLGNVYVSDTFNHRVKMIDPAGVVTNFAGSGYEGSQDGIGTSASFSYPAGIAVDSERNIYVADWYNHTIRKITQSGQVTTIAGVADSGSSIDGPRQSARLYYPFGVAIRSDNSLFITEPDTHTVRRITPDGYVTSIAGRPFTPGNLDGTGTNARFFIPDGIAVDRTGRVAVADTYNHAVRIGTFAPPTATLTAATTSIREPGYVTLQWSSTNASSASIGPIVGPVGVSGSTSVYVSTTTTFTLTVTGDGGTATSSVVVTVGGSAKRRAVGRS